MKKEIIIEKHFIGEEKVSPHKTIVEIYHPHSYMTPKDIKTMVETLDGTIIVSRILYQQE